MRTRRGNGYSVCTSLCRTDRPFKRARIYLSNTFHGCDFNGTNMISLWESPDQDTISGSNPFDTLPDDLLLCIFERLAASSSAPADLLCCKQTCRRFNSITGHPLVLAKVSAPALRVKASSWCPESSSFLERCADAGNIESCYMLGMISFYCLNERERGIMLMSRAAKVLHPWALHSLAVIQFNGSGGARKHKNLRAGVSLCARAATLGHIDAMRELGHCLQDGYGITRNVLEGRKLLLEANAREAAAAVASSFSDATGRAIQVTAARIAIGCFQHHFRNQLVRNKAYDTQTSMRGEDNDGDARRHRQQQHPLYKLLQSGGCSLLSDFGCNVPPPKLHVAHRFLVEWFTISPPPDGLRLCSHEHCGRPETRRHEFRRCSACGSVNYCSRACQALDWKLRHKLVCISGTGNLHHRPLQHNVHEQGAGNGIHAPLLVMNQQDYNEPEFNDENYEADHL
ncbi:hypothetical protein KP509_28G046200 [Ceratopteris richardii]|uniref:MYND-type domain-containing protein n=1 Tax=Ceratopteris richardii TaxID=49495 RepID=A0A8T2RD21_CERRI|nr:hypothetical protein KP509_28G046200 [Ceratopteris richardii]